MRLIQRHHDKDTCLCLANGVAGFTALVVKDPVPATATYMGTYGDADWPAHTWDLDPVQWRSVSVGANGRASVMASTLTDERAAEILASIQRVYCGPAAPMPLDPAIFARPVPPEPEPYPEPIVTSRDGQEPATRPGPVDGLVAQAEALGWTTRVTYAEGWVPHATHGTPGKAPKVSWAIRMQRGDYRAVAVRMGDSWDTLSVVGPTGLQRYSTLGAFQAAIV